jgi:hypothetical protein
LCSHDPQPSFNRPAGIEAYVAHPSRLRGQIKRFGSGFDIITFGVTGFSFDEAEIVFLLRGSANTTISDFSD